jgi:hypothetical protein
MFNKNFGNAAVVALVAIFTSGGPSFAQSSPKQMGETADRIAVLQMRLQELELEEKIRVKEMGGITKPVEAPKSESVSRPELPMSSQYELPQVISVEGSKGKLTAVLAYQGVVKQGVHEGEDAFGFLVQKISLTEVTAQDVATRKSKSLQFTNRKVTPEFGMNARNMGALIPPLPSAVNR